MSEKFPDVNIDTDVVSTRQDTTRMKTKQEIREQIQQMQRHLEANRVPPTTVHRVKGEIDALKWVLGEDE